MTEKRGLDTGMIFLIAILVVLAMAWALVGLGGHHLGNWIWGGWDHSPRMGLLYPLFSLGTLIQLVLAVWVGFDSNRRGMNGFLWGLLVFFTSVVGLIVYLIVVSTTNGRALANAPPAAAAVTVACAGCGSGVEPGFKVCPYCGRPIASECPGCHRPTSPDWKVCPHCTTPLAAEDPK